MATRPNPAALGRHMKAALVLAGMTLSELAAEVQGELQIGRGTLERIMQGKRIAKPYEIREIARALGVPEAFLLEGPAAAAGAVGATRLPTDLVSWLEALEEHVDQLREWAVEDGARLARVERLLDADAEPPPVRHIGSQSDSRR